VQRSEPFSVRGIVRLLRETSFQWSNGNAFVYAGALAYYTIFSIVPLLTLLINLTVYFAGAYRFERQIISLLTRQYSITIAPLDTASTTDQILNIVRSRAGDVPAAFLSEIVQGHTQTTGGLAATLISVLFLIYGASTVFHQLHNSINAMYGLPEGFTTISHGVLYYVIARLLSAAAVILVGLFFVLLLAVNVILLLAGNFMETSSIVLIFAPILFPVAVALGIHPVHFGILMVVNMEVGMCHPPVGLNLYVASGITKMGITELTVAVWPWLMTMLGFLALVTYWPDLSLFLPRMLGMK